MSPASSRPAPARLLWDAGGLWSLWTLEACRAQGWDIAPISAARLADGGLDQARVLVMPGGWPSLKRAALGQAGAAAIKAFVEAGGRYLGFCGGAGLALAEDDGLGLVDMARGRGRRRLPSLSGPVMVAPGPEAAQHPLWRGLETPARFHVWFPGQFAAESGESFYTVARYGHPAPGLHTADLRVDQVDQTQWPALEEAYGLRLDPSGLAGRAAVVEARRGAGRLLLSYLHLDTPGDPVGGQALANLWRTWLDLEPVDPPPRPAAGQGEGAARASAREAEALWSRGEALGLWRPRDQALPLWRRGARGLEFHSLRSLCQALADRACPPRAGLAPEVLTDLEELWREGPAVLAWQAANLAGDDQPPPPAARSWFPAPRRSGGALGRVLAALEGALLRAEQAARR